MLRKWLKKEQSAKMREGYSLSLKRFRMITLNFKCSGGGDDMEVERETDSAQNKFGEIEDRIIHQLMSEKMPVSNQKLAHSIGRSRSCTIEAVLRLQDVGKIRVTIVSKNYYLIRIVGE